MTGSYSIAIEVIHHNIIFCITYTTMEKAETEKASGVLVRGRVANGMKFYPFAMDDYGRFSESSNSVIMALAARSNCRQEMLKLQTHGSDSEYAFRWMLWCDDVMNSRMTKLEIFVLRA